jgi:phosphoribosylaminoimidazolecarboxamide formyltransferase/IMP cyclohydrolase
MTNALISVYHKEGLEDIVRALHDLDISIYSTGGTQRYIEALDIPVKTVESLTSYPSILGGRVKTLHPKVFGGILARRHEEGDVAQLSEYEIPTFGLVIVDLYPFEETVANSDDEATIIEKIDIGGIALIRAAAKNYRDTLVVSNRNQYQDLLDILNTTGPKTTLEQRKQFALNAFNTSSHYDSAIFNYFNDGEQRKVFKQSILTSRGLRYGENPHQTATYYGNLEDLFEKHGGKELSYNNLVDIDAAVNIIAEYDDCTFAILKHTNSCGLASRPTVLEAWNAALACDNVSAFGGILITNREVDASTAQEIDKLFFEVIIAPAYSADALEVLKVKKKRIILEQKPTALPNKIHKTLLNGVIEQEKDVKIESAADLKGVTKASATETQIADLIFASKAVKHLKSNGIALV